MDTRLIVFLSASMGLAVGMIGAIAWNTATDPSAKTQAEFASKLQTAQQKFDSARSQHSQEIERYRDEAKNMKDALIATKSRLESAIQEGASAQRRLDEAMSNDNSIEEVETLRIANRRLKQENESLSKRAADTHKALKDLEVNTKNASSPRSSKRLSTRGFQFHNVSFNDESIVGQVTNTNSSSYKMTGFTMSVFNRDGKLIEAAPVVVMDIRSGETKSFSSYCEDGLPRGGYYEFQLDSAL